MSFTFKSQDILINHYYLSAFLRGGKTKNVVFQMFETVEDIKKNNKVRSVIICSLAPGVFCAGTLSLFIALEGY